MKSDKRNTPEHREHLRKIGFQKGREKTGGRVATPPEVRAAMAERSMDAVAVMEDLMHNSTNESVRQKAAAYFLDAQVSKAPTTNTLEVTHTHSIAGMLSQANQMRSAANDAPDMKDVTPGPAGPVLIEVPRRD